VNILRAGLEAKTRASPDASGDAASCTRGAVLL
jgi:hypothetical protein